jgi:hypothetical protein
VAYSVLYVYLEQVIDTGIGIPRHPLFFLGYKRAWRTQAPEPEGSNGTTLSPNVEVAAEERRVAKLDKSECAILIRALRKVYPGRGGTGTKVACRSLSLGVDYGECFGMLGPNGAGKTSVINMLVGFVPPTAGVAFVAGKDIATQSVEVHAEMGLCPQHDLLWESLSAREHLTFYGRLKGLRGVPLKQAVDTALRQVNLFEVGDKQSGQYSGGMKRSMRLLDTHPALGPRSGSRCLCARMYASVCALCDRVRVCARVRVCVRACVHILVLPLFCLTRALSVQGYPWPSLWWGTPRCAPSLFAVGVQQDHCGVLSGGIHGRTQYRAGPFCTPKPVAGHHGSEDGEGDHPDHAQHGRGGGAVQQAWYLC